MTACPAPTASWRSPTRPPIAPRTKGATWCVKERTPLSQVWDRVRRQRPVLPPRRQHARGGAGKAPHAAAPLRPRPPLDGRHHRPHTAAGETGARSRDLSPGRGARLALRGPEEAGRRGHVVRLPRPRGGERARRGDQGALPQARHRQKLGGAAATRGRARHATRPSARLSHPAPRRVRGWADLPGDALPEGGAALGPRGEGRADESRRRDRDPASGVRRAAPRARAAERAPRPEAGEQHARGRGQRPRPGGGHGLRPGEGATRRSGHRQAHRDRDHPRDAGVHEPRADPGQAARRPLRHLRPRYRCLRDVHRQVAVPGTERSGDDDRAAARPATEAASGPRRSPRGPGERAGPRNGGEPRRALHHGARIRRRAHRVPRRQLLLENQGEAEIRRLPALDPPEYVEWQPDPALVRGFRETIERDPERAAVIARLSLETKLGLYAGLLRARLHDIQLKRWVRTGVISKAWLGTGEEATTVGPGHGLRGVRDVVAPMIRNAAACCELGLSVAEMLRAYLATDDSPSRGRDLHVGSWGHGVLQPISHVGDMVPVITGIALTFKMRGEKRVALTWIGDGSTKTAAAHEGTNFAAVQRVPAVFIIENNQVALGTRLDQHHLPGHFKDWPAQYGIWGAEFDGNNVLDAWAATRIAAERCRSGQGPALLVAETFRMGGHATHDEREARETFSDELFKTWGKRDPIGLYEEYLKEEGVPAQRLEQVEADVTAQVEAAAEEALESRAKMPPAESALDGVYAKDGR